MNRPRIAAASALAFTFVFVGGLSFGGSAHAQTFPVVKGTQELQIGFSMMSMPEIVSVTWSAHPELRWGIFLGEGFEAQLTADMRVWPLGIAAPRSYGGGLNLLWFPNLGQGHRNLYLLLGGGGAWTDPAEPTIDASLDPAGRVGLGAKVSLEQLGLPFLVGWHLTTEYRGEFVYLNEDSADYPGLPESASTGLDFVSGVTVGVSILR